MTQNRTLKKHNTEWLSYCKDRELEYRLALKEWFAQRHQVAEDFKLSHRKYIYEIVRNIRAYANGGDFANTPLKGVKYEN